MTRIIFEKCRAVGVRSTTIDGKRTCRQRTFWQTVSPFNTNPDGTVKTRAEVQASVNQEALEWERTHD